MQGTGASSRRSAYFANDVGGVPAHRSYAVSAAVAPGQENVSDQERLGML
jgi:hypothetical protein